MNISLNTLKNNISTALNCETDILDISSCENLTSLIQIDSFSPKKLDGHINNCCVFTPDKDSRYIPCIIDKKYFFIKLTSLSTNDVNLFEKVNLIVTLYEENVKYEHTDIMKKNETRSFFLNKILNYQNEEETISIMSWNFEMGYNLDLPRTTCVISFRNLLIQDYKKYNRSLNHLKASILERVEAHSFITHEDIVSYVNAEQLVICKYTQTDNIGKLKESFMDYFNDIDSFAQDNHGIKLSCGIGLCHDGFQNIRNSFEEAVFALEVNSKPGLAFVEDYLLEYVINKIPIEMLDHFLKDKYKLIKNRQELIDTIDALVKNDMNIGKAASSIFVHKNTLLFRIRNIKNILKLDPFHKEKDRITLLLLHHYINDVNKYV